MRFRIDDESSSQAASQKFLSAIRKARRMARKQSSSSNKGVRSADLELLVSGARSPSCNCSAPFQTAQEAHTVLVPADGMIRYQASDVVGRGNLHTKSWLCSDPTSRELQLPALTSTTNSHVSNLDFSSNLGGLLSFLQQPPTEKMRFRIDEERASQAESRKFQYVTRKARRMARQQAAVPSENSQSALSLSIASPIESTSQERIKERIAFGAADQAARTLADLAASQEEAHQPSLPSRAPEHWSASAVQAPAHETAHPVLVPGSAFHVPRRPTARLPQSPPPDLARLRASSLPPPPPPPPAAAVLWPLRWGAAPPAGLPPPPPPHYVAGAGGGVALLLGAPAALPWAPWPPPTPPLPWRGLG